MQKSTPDDKVKLLEEELAKTKAALLDTQMVFDTILESTLAGYWDWQIQKNTEYLSPTFKKMFGYADHEMQNTPDAWQKIIHPDDLQVVLNSYRKHVETKGEHPYHNEVRYYHKNGSIVWVFCSGKVIEWDDKDNPVRMVGSHVNVTPLKEALQRIKNQKDMFKEKGEEMEQFAYIVSHDLQEPIRTINSFSALFKSQYGDNLDAGAEKLLTFITDASKRMNDLVQGLLEYSRIGKNVEFKSVDCNALLGNVLEDMATKISNTNAKIKAANLPTVKADETMLRSLFQNLISNAIKFQKAGSDPIVIIKAEEKDLYWLFHVADNGIGINEKHKKKIFAIFQRLHTSDEYEGTGIGLAHCKKIVELHQGKIDVTSKLGEGSTFSFTLKK